MDYTTTFTKFKTKKIFFKRTRALFLLFFISFCFYAHSQCTPVLDCTDGDLITNVTMSTITNNSTCGANGYNDFTSITAPVLNEGETHSISVTVGDGWSNESVSVWIDYNEDALFDTSEFTYIGTGSGSVVTGDIIIPTDLITGDKTMRVRVAAVGATSATSDMACDDSQGFGETEDYTVHIIGTLSVEEFHMLSNISVFKQQNSFVINSSNQLLDEISIYDISGKRVLNKSKIKANTVAISTSALGRQLYILEIKTSNGEVFTKKVVN